MTHLIEEQIAANKPTTKRPCKMAREPEVAPPSPTEPRVNKSQLIIGLMQRACGATLDELVAATGWLPHTTCAALTGLKKKGHQLTNDKVDGLRRYRIESSNA